MAGAMDRRFQMAEQQLRRKELQREQQEKEGLKRRFASLGALGSGASIKAESQAGEAASRRMAEGSQKIEMARLGEQARQEEIAGQRAFATGERIAGQEFAGSQAELGRKFATGERMSAQEFATGERVAGSELAKELQGMKDAMTQKEIDLQAKELEISEIVTAYNTENIDLFRDLVEQKYPGTFEGGGKAAEGAEVAQGAGDQAIPSQAVFTLDPGTAAAIDASESGGSSANVRGQLQRLGELHARAVQTGNSTEAERLRRQALAITKGAV